MQQQMTPEQAKELQERLSKMSPEELKAYQKQQCIFCQIIEGKVQSKKIYEDEQSIAIMDINPANPGHLLILPKEHYAIMPLIPKDIIGHLFMVAKALSQIMLKAIGAEGVNIFVANGVPAGQKAQHFMLHVIPRKEKDGVALTIPSMKAPTEQLIQIKDALKAKIKEQLGYEPEEEGVVEAEFTDISETEVTDDAQKALLSDKQGLEVTERGLLEPEEEPEVEEVSETEEEPDDDKKFITSEKAKRFHVETCPFGKNIKEDSRLYCTKEECEEAGKKPCDCTGLIEEKEEVEDEPEQEEKEEPPKKKSKKDSDEVDLDDIARTLGL